MGEDLDGLSDLTSEFVSRGEDESSRLEDGTVGSRRRTRSRSGRTEVWIPRRSSSREEVWFDCAGLDPRGRDVRTFGLGFGRFEGLDDGESVRDRLS